MDLLSLTVTLMQSLTQPCRGGTFASCSLMTTPQIRPPFCWTFPPPYYPALTRALVTGFAFVAY